MRLKSFTAPTMDEAMRQVREALGDNAVIVSTYQGKRGRGVAVIAAKDNPKSERTLADTMARGAPEPSDPLSAVLAFHGVPEPLAERLRLGAKAAPAGDPVLALAAALDSAFAFEPLAENPDRPVLLVGPPGAGKTLVAAKLAARAVLAGFPVRVVTTDTVRAGAVAQLSAFTDILKTPLIRAGTPEELATALAEGAEGSAWIIDSPATGPFQSAALADLRGFLDAVDAEPVAVLAAGGDAQECADAARAFADLGVRRLIATQLDVARRTGGILNAAHAAVLAFAGASVSPYVAQGIATLNPVSLARTLLRDPATPAAVQDTAAE